MKTNSWTTAGQPKGRLSSSPNPLVKKKVREKSREYHNRKPQRRPPPPPPPPPPPQKKFYEEAVIESEARTAAVQLKSEA